MFQKLETIERSKKAMETDALMEKWKNEKTCFPTFPQALGKLFEFPTVPTASTTGYKLRNSDRRMKKAM
jgi:hypothetical protein